jgi:signal transduction histidine kinase
MRQHRDRWVAVAAVVVVLVLGGLIITTVRQAQTNGRKALEALQLDQAKQLAREFDSLFEQVNIALNPIVNAAPWNLKPNDPVDAGRLGRLQNPGARTGIVLVDRNKVITNGTLLQRAKVGDRLSRPELDLLLTPDAKPRVLPLAPGVTTALPTIAISYPLKDPSGGTAGAYLSEAEVSPESPFTAIVKGLGRGRTGTFSFVDDDGNIIASSDPSLVGTSGRALALPATSGTRFVRHDGYVYATAVVPTPRWTSIFRQRASEFDGSLTRPVRSALLLLALATVLVGGGAFFFLLRRLRAARQEQQRLAEINAIREEFMSIVSHELRTPITGLLGFLQTTLDHWDSMSDDDRQNAVLRAGSNARRLHSLTRDVLDTASLETGELTYNFERVDLAAEVASAATAAQDVQPTRPITLTSAPGPAWVHGDPERIQQVLTNLIDNAMKNSAPESPIEVSVDLADGEATVSVTDRGAGIPSEELGRVFEKFVRGRGSDSRGSGLGLYICQRIVAAHGGRIWASSQEGVGATLTFALPLAPTPSEPAPA